MEGQNRSGELKDFAHLFLSGKSPSASKDSAVRESVMWIVNSGEASLRSFISSGVSSLIAGKDINVTLVEVARGMPNAGFLFAMPPEEYLLPLLRSDACTVKKVNPLLRFACASGPENFKSFDNGFLNSGRAHIIVETFDVSACAGGLSFSSLRELASLYSVLSSKRDLSPAVVLLVGQESLKIEEELAEEIESFAPRASMFVQERGGRGASLERASERIRIPATSELISDRRVPPEGEFFETFVNSALQKISARFREERKSVP